MYVCVSSDVGQWDRHRGRLEGACCALVRGRRGPCPQMQGRMQYAQTLATAAGDSCWQRLTVCWTRNMVVRRLPLPLSSHSCPVLCCMLPRLRLALAVAVARAGKSKGVAMVEFGDADSARRCKDQLSGWVMWVGG